MNELASNLYQEILLKQQQEELEEYKQILDSNNIVLKTDVHLKITYVNELFCEISGYNSDELIGKELKSLDIKISHQIFTQTYMLVF